MALGGSDAQVGFRIVSRTGRWEEEEATERRKPRGKIMMIMKAIAPWDKGEQDEDGKDQKPFWR